MSQPNYANWLKRSQWTLIEAAALTAGVEPARTDSPHVQMAVIDDPDARQRFDDVYRELKSVTRNEEQRRANGFTDVEKPRTDLIGNTRVLPLEFINWLMRADFEFHIPEPLRNACEASSVPRQPTTQSATREPEARADDEIAKWFDPVTVAALDVMFPAREQWKKWAERAKDNGLIVARSARARFNPYRAGKWFLTKGEPGWTEARLCRVLANHLPARSANKREQLTLAGNE